MKKEPKLVNTCKLCQLIKKDKKLWLSVHTKIIEDALPSSLVCEWLNRQIEILGYTEINPFNEANFSVHFSKHISDEDARRRVYRQMILSGTDTRAFSDEDRETARIPIDGKPEDDEVDLENYRFLQECLQDAKGHLKKYGDLLASTTTNKTPQGYGNNLEGYYKMLSEVVKVQEVISKLKSSERVAGRAVYVAVEVVSSEILTALIEVVKEATDILEQELKGSKLPKEIKDLIINRTRSKTIEAANGTIKRVYETFGIK